MATRIGDVLLGLPAKLRLDGNAKQTLDVARHRVTIASVLFAIAFGVVSLRLVDVTVIKQGHEPRAAQALSVGNTTERADIVDRNGELLATSLATASLYANPRQIANPADVAAQLAAVLPGLDERELTDRLKAERSFAWIRRNLTPRQQFAVNRLGIPGLFFQREERRVYPHANLAGQIVGFTDIDNRGIAGIEQSFDEKLTHNAEPVRLSIDLRVQHLVREELARQIETFKAIGGMSIVLDVETGEVVALVSLPDFDPNSPALASEDARFNRNTLGVYEMGSTFKLFTAAMAIDSGTVSLRDGFDASRPIQISRFTISDYKGQHRYLTVPEIIMYSSNIGAAKMAVATGTARQRDFLSKVGLLRPSPIELPEVASPMIPHPWREISTMTIGFGHGISVTPLHLATGVAAVVNGGILRPATIIKRADRDAAPGERVMSTATSEQVRKLMRMVVERGTGKSANVPGYLVGGKTGTAEKTVKGQYKRNALLSSFVSAFPMTRPRFVVLAMLDEPHGNASTQGYATGGWVAAPLVGRVIQRIAPLLGVPPIDESAPAVREQMVIAAAVR
jgi:cell division protein FtsI (penicillin-binding protein 3)